jgi:hypothetical protein
MAGIFDVINNQNTPEGARTAAASFMDGLFLMKVSGIRTNAELRAILESEIERTLTAEEIQDLLDVVTYIEAGTGESGKVARLHRFTAVAGIWETGQGNITEAEARAMTGVTFS